MELAELEQRRLYEEYWAKVEERFKAADENLDLFLRDYIALKRLPSPAPVGRYRIDRVYDEFKDFKRSHTEGLEALLKDIRRFSGYYLDLLGHGAKPGAFAEPMSYCKAMGTTHAVLGMKLYDRNQEGASRRLQSKCRPLERLCQESRRLDRGRDA